MTYVKGYGVLAGYLLLTQLVGLNYWEIDPNSRPIWIVGALSLLGVLILAPWRRQVQ